MVLIIQAGQTSKNEALKPENPKENIKKTKIYKIDHKINNKYKTTQKS